MTSSQDKCRLAGLCVRDLVACKPTVHHVDSYELSRIDIRTLLIQQIMTSLLQKRHIVKPSTQILRLLMSFFVATALTRVQYRLHGWHSCIMAAPLISLMPPFLVLDLVREMTITFVWRHHSKKRRHCSSPLLSDL